MRALILVWLCATLFVGCEKKPENKPAPLPPPDTAVAVTPEPEPAATAEPEPEPEQPSEPAAPLADEDPLPPVVREPVLKLVGAQFWIYRVQDDKLAFNTPWDEEPGSGVVHDADSRKVPPYAKACAAKAEEAMEAALAQADFASRFERLKDLKATTKVILLVNAIPDEQHKAKLVDLDRDAYFWHSNSLRERPALSMSRFTAGQWVWEVIAYPEDGCTLPSHDDMRRYLDYAATRLASKKERV